MSVQVQVHQQAEIYQIPRLDEAGVIRSNANYKAPHPGVSVVYHIAQDGPFAEEVRKVQTVVWNILIRHGLEKCVKFYQPKQIHCSVIHLYDQPNQPNGLDKVAQVIKNTQPLKFIFGPNAHLVENGRDQTLRVTPEGQGVMKGVAIDADLLPVNRERMLEVREEFNKIANITHRYPKDSQVYAVLFYFLNTKVNENQKCLIEIDDKLKEISGKWDLQARVDKVAIASFKYRTLDPESTKQIEVYLGKDNPHIENLAEVLKALVQYNVL